MVLLEYTGMRRVGLSDHWIWMLAAPATKARGCGRVFVQQMAGMAVESQGDATNERGSADVSSVPSNWGSDGEVVDVAGATSY